MQAVITSRIRYEQSGLGPADVPVVELHDCFSTNEFISYEGLGRAKKANASSWMMTALQHNLGLGGACVVAMYKRA